MTAPKHRRPDDRDSEENAAPADESTDLETRLKKFRRKERVKSAAGQVGAVLLLAAQVLVVVVALFTVYLNVEAMTGRLHYSIVTSGSMTGTLNVGDIAVTHDKIDPHQKFEVGDIVLIASGDGSIVHRIVEVNENGTYTTKGDANDRRDLFQPTGEDIRGELVNIYTQPLATIVAVFSPSPQWYSSVWVAATSFDFGKVPELVATAPWGALSLLVAVAVFWWLIPDLIDWLKRRRAIRDRLDRERLKLTVEGHEESIAEIEPVVEELKQDHDAEKAEKEAERAFAVAAQEGALNWLSSANPDAMYDDEPTTADTTPAVVNPFDAIRARNASRAALARDLSEFPAADASSRTAPSRNRGRAHSAFDFDAMEED